MSTLTSANSVLMLGVDKLYNTPVQIQGYSVDDAFAVEEVEMGETMMGIDGKLSAGYTPYVVPLEITLQANSVSNDVFDAIIQAEAIAKEKYQLNASILIPSISMLFTFTTGYLQKGSIIPEAKKVLQPRKFTIDFQNATRAPA